jgi:hypothetical protein
MKTSTNKWLLGMALVANVAVAAGPVDPPTSQPCWRGQAGTTYQLWGFDTDPGDPYNATVLADTFNNSAGQAAAVIVAGPTGIGWYNQDFSGDFMTNTAIPNWASPTAPTGFWDLGYGGGSCVLTVPNTPAASGTREVWVKWVEATSADFVMTNIVTVDGGTLEASSYEKLGIETNANYTWWLVRTKWQVPATTVQDVITIVGGCDACNSSGGGQSAFLESVVVDTINLPTTANHAPTMNTVNASTPQSKPLVFLVKKLVDTASDQENDCASITAVATQPANGAVVLNNLSGTLTYTPVGTFTGADSFTFTLSDLRAATTVTVNITVGATNVQGANVVFSGTTNILGVDNFMAIFAAIPGTNYTIEYTTNVSPATWFWRANLATDPAGHMIFVEPKGLIPQRFYRTVFPSRAGTYTPGP